MRLLAAFEEGIGLFLRLPLLALCVAPVIDLSTDAIDAFRCVDGIRSTEDHTRPDGT